MVVGHAAMHKPLCLTACVVARWYQIRFLKYTKITVEQKKCRRYILRDDHKCFEKQLWKAFKGDITNFSGNTGSGRIEMGKRNTWMANMCTLIQL